MKRMGWAVVALVLCGSGFLPGHALAHHEAIFGPQSSLMFSEPGFVSVQLFTRQLGTSDRKTQETTTLVSAGYEPFDGTPLSFSGIFPVSYIDEPGGTADRSGLEDFIFGVRYRFDLEALQESTGKTGNFILGMGAVEVPNGKIDHDPGKGALDYMTAVLGSVERGEWSGIAYAFFRFNGEYDHEQPGDFRFYGGGVAYTPFDDPETEELLSFQLGVSYEIYDKDQVDGKTVDESGGTELLLHPTIVWGPGEKRLLFFLVSIPVARDFNDPAEQDRWRAGMGFVQLFGREE